MKKLIILIILGVGGYYLVQNMFFKEDSQAVKTYKQFANAYVVRDYDNAMLYAAGNTASMLEEKQSSTRMQFMGREISTPLSEKGRLEGVMYNIKSEESSGDDVAITASMRASISWAGSTANPNAPGSYVGHAQTATVRNTASGWKVVEFTDSITSKPR
ncbi:MAG: hypothetical protein OQL16_06735 [Gammaproteobacteria bacterium]|nr:hypothetical protein [Gammaproteobacteria bacterium]